MKVGCCSIKFYLHGNGSLKGKRRVVKSIKDRLKNKFNVSVAEVGDQDVWQTIHLGISAISGDHKYLDGQMNHLVDFIEKMNLAEITDCQVQIINLGDGKL